MITSRKRCYRRWVYRPGWGGGLVAPEDWQEGGHYTAGL